MDRSSNTSAVDAVDESGPSEARAYSGESEPEQHELDALVAEALAAKAEMIALVEDERTAKVRQIRALRQFEAKGYHRALCMGIDDLAVEVGIARNRREAKDLLRTGSYLDRAPRVRAVFEAGGVDWTKVRDVGHVLTPTNEDVWLSRMTTSTNERLRALVREDQGLPAVRRLTHEVTPVVGALYDQVVLDVRRSADRPLDEDEVFETILRRAQMSFTKATQSDEIDPESESASECEEPRKVEKASSDPFRPTTMVVIHRCDECKRTTMQDKNGTVEVPEATYELHGCNSVTLDIREGPARVTRAIPRKIANLVLVRDRLRCRVPGCKNRAWIEIHHEGGRAVVGHDPTKTMVLCTAHHMDLHRGYLRAEIEGEAIRFFRRDGVEIREHPHVGQNVEPV